MANSPLAPAGKWSRLVMTTLPGPARRRLCRCPADRCLKFIGEITAWRNDDVPEPLGNLSQFGGRLDRHVSPVDPAFGERALHEQDAGLGSQGTGALLGSRSTDGARPDRAVLPDLRQSRRHRGVISFSSALIVRAPATTR